MDHELELRHLRSFVAVAEHLHFGRAAVALHLAQPALSQQMRRLEEILGAQLLQRTSRSVSLTPAGSLLLQRAHRTLDAMRIDVDDVRRLGRGEEGSLNVGFISSAMLSRLPAMLQNYRSFYPKVHLRLAESFTSQVLQGLADGSLDAGLVRDSDPMVGIHTEPVWTERYIALLPRHHPLAGKRGLRPSSLCNEPFVFYSRSAGALAYDKPLDLCTVRGVRPRVVQEASHWLTIVRLIEAGLGVSIAPASVRAMAANAVVCVPLIGVKARSVVELAYRADEQNPLVQQFAFMARCLLGQGEELDGP